MEIENTLATSDQVQPLTEIKSELKKIVAEFPKRYGYAEKVKQRLAALGKIVSANNVFNTVHSKTYYDSVIAREIKALLEEYKTGMSNDLQVIKAAN